MIKIIVKEKNKVEGGVSISTFFKHIYIFNIRVYSMEYEVSDIEENKSKNKKVGFNGTV